ncbi:hypothetical protein FBU59_001031 [Linderina macrospora]|uniref:Uncharacterized protein n=1 Tax=Linderina macrospora TaxID=4868 RepID=A0ACC1JFD5_9FUNG|nr:hypothetical protein FBU59_001031 [Linderina macrospora]
MSSIIQSIKWEEVLERLKTIGGAKITGTLADAVLGYKVIYALFFSLLRNIPGPFLAHLASLHAHLINATGEIGTQHARIS